jgi:CxxC motif-containing protein (DUF1111 family)
MRGASLMLAIAATPVLAITLMAADGKRHDGNGGNGNVRGAPTGSQTLATEAPAGFDALSNGLTDQATFDADRDVFEERESVDDGLGPVYNAESCVECHQSPTAGGTSQITELRAGYRTGRGDFTDPPGGSLINDRAIHSDIMEGVPEDATVRTFRSSLNTLGDGFVEAIADETLVAIADQQARRTRGAIAGEIVRVPVLEAPGTNRVGRFGWKNQHASLVSFAADAYVNEMGITSPLQPNENTSMGMPLTAYDHVADPEDDGDDLEIFARFIRATKAPSRNEQLAATSNAQRGARLFESVGCLNCHVSDIVTAPVGTVINGGAFIVPDALGDKVIHPYGDFLLHDVGTGDGVKQNGGRSTTNKLRTMPLWGLRTRTRFMHDGASVTLNDAILRHRGEASFVTRSYQSLSDGDRRRILAFLDSL